MEPPDVPTYQDLRPYHPQTCPAENKAGVGPPGSSALRWGMWVLGADSSAAALRAAAAYTLEGYAPVITCPTLVLDGENDPGHASQLYEALRCQKTYHLFPAAEGAASTAKWGRCSG
jgi:pimeloyl-ACP methyl ester carboxylesterase